MVNTNIQAPINLAGKGHINKLREGYTSGEYTKLINAELDADGRIINRRPIRFQGGSFTGSRIDKVRDFIGYFGPNPIVVGNDGMYLYPPDSSIARVNLWSPSNLPYYGHTVNYCIIKKFIRYNGKNYWICVEYELALDEFRIRLVYNSTVLIDITDTSTSFNMTNWGAQTSVVVQTRAGSDGQIIFKDAFIHKERLWIITEDYAYFSKATDPLTWTPPEGGFFKFSEAYINAAVGVKNNIYLIGDNSIYILSYTTDPNVDSIVYNLSGSAGGDSCAVYEDVVYVIRDNFLYSVVNNNVTKVLDLDLGFYGVSSINTDIVSFGNYLVFLRYSKFLAGSGTSTSESRLPHTTKNRGHPVASYKDPNTSEISPHVFFLNMDNGSIHALDFRDCLEQADDLKGYVSSLMFVPNEDGFNSFRLYLLTKNYNNSITDYSGVVYQMPLTTPGYKRLAIPDQWTSASGSTNRTLPNVDIEIKGFVPDGNEFMIKKFRHLLLQGTFPTDSLTIRVGFDDKSYGSDKILGIDTSQTPGFILDSEASEVVPVRIPINQRARSLNINIRRTPTWDEDSLGFDLGGGIVWTIEKMIALWSYTQKPVISPNPRKTIP